jgi:hypothetical protein
MPGVRELFHELRNQLTILRCNAEFLDLNRSALPPRGETDLAALQGAVQDLVQSSAKAISTIDELQRMVEGFGGSRH